ncbi:glycoside hydrolase family 31 protein [Flavivirga eckloniae]|uniref:Alpha-xylosidase n=1 Tax=Flavivirga eckloniae TaxID=1803846 RepID=A0A2K9PM60_9FLAO|nr:alpha-xylosidase [Flavivirga eckloniae]AUP78115.1 alpha-xylosidase [Flavivirga eckloniae]
MKRTNYQLFDFMDLSPSLDEEECLWIAGQYKNIQEDQGDILIDIPFIKQNNSNDIQPDLEAAPLMRRLRIRAYGSRILRVAFDEGEAKMTDSLMLDWHSDLAATPLKIKSSDDCIKIIDELKDVRAELNLASAEIDYWSDLLPPAPETINITLYPEKGKAVKINGQDQFFPRRRDGLPIAFVEKDACTDRSAFSLACDPNEQFCGTGERFSKMDLSGKTIQLENQDAQGVNNNRAYKNIPFFISSRMYGFFLHTTAFSKISFADHSTRSVQVLSEYNQMDFFLFGGSSIEEILYSYKQVTGFPTLLPKWSFGTWMSRMTYFSADEVNNICDRLRKEDYPCDVIHLDTGWFKTDWLCEWTFNSERFPDPKGFISKLRDNGYKVSLWQLPYIAADAKQHDEAKENKYFAPLKEIKEQGGSNFSALDYAGTIDFTNPKAVKWYKELLKNLLDMGVVCIKTDFGEEIHLEADYHGMDARLLQNLYPLLYQKAAYEVTKEVTGDGIVWARAAWAGCQRFPLHWGGDAACTWDGMAGSLKGGLHLGLSGFGYWSHDVPGFHGIPNFMNTVIPDDLYIRWTQFGVFTSHLRYHGTSKREPYEYPLAASIVKKWWKLRYALLPYIWQQSERVTNSGFTFLRALIFHHPNDKVCWNIHDQYFFGDDFLVAPVMNSENKRDIYLPEGTWINFFNGEKVNGPIWLYNQNIPLEEMPVWVRFDASVAFYPEPVNSTDDVEEGKETTIVFNDSYKGIAHTVIGDLVGF